MKYIECFDFRFSSRSYILQLTFIIKNMIQMNLRSLLLVFIFFFEITSFKDCNFTQFDFFSTYSLGKQDELNRTFAILNSKIKNLASIEFKSNRSILYSINQAIPVFNYLDSNQTGQIISDNLIYIKGGKASTQITFNWSKDQLKGTGIANCLSDSISFAKLTYFSGGFINFKLADYKNITYYGTTCNITRFDPAPEKDDVTILLSMINDLQPNNLRTKLQQQIWLNYQSALNSSLYDERQPLDTKYTYNWVDPTPGKSNLTIQYTLLPTGGHLKSIGLSLIFVTQITEYENWKCGPTVPSSPKDPKTYGGIQEFLSISILQNSIRYAIEKGQLNTKLNQRNWQSQVFQFYAGDLFQIIPLLGDTYFASQSVVGSCNTTTEGLRLFKGTNETLSLGLVYKCELNIGTVRISSFDIDSTFSVKIVAKQDRLDFQVVNCDKFAHFKDEGQFLIHDIELANFFLNQSLKRLLEGTVFGSNWKTYSRNYPQVKIEDEFIFIYDAANSQ